MRCFPRVGDSFIEPIMSVWIFFLIALERKTDEPSQMSFTVICYVSKLDETFVFLPSRVAEKNWKH